MDEYAESKNNNLFQQYWAFFCLTTRFIKKNDFLVKDIANTSVLLRFDGHSIRAFENRCLHRNAQIYSEKSGNGYLICPFHGWGYRSDGALATIPYNDQMYGFDESKCSNIRLKEFKIEIVGKFIFLNLSDAPLKIEDQFSLELLEDLKSISNNIDSSYSMTTIHAKCNWKLIMEIVMDELHIPFVHPSTISTKKPFDPPTFIEGEDLKFSHIKDLSYKSASLLPHVEETWHHMVEEYPAKGSYLDYYFFPNLHFMVPTGGHSFAYCALFPQEYDLTSIDYFYTTAKRKINNRIFSIVHSEAIGFGLRTFKEDIVMMENVQKSASSAILSGNYGKYEKRISAWRNYFRDNNFE
ncbi:SRPBCC family protein [Polynucleobacter sp. AP-Feld-500C-C5]|uniref:aromatic ring-hydroxylating oxygenase subunit alpha n=1 Tax=Polynucleobacter sp. AP-Feld-500C-C5 TaxID=2576924 RepID=UPI001C0D6890|nr:aromatic ring-hydroxylating dioxygenase subunit alpha [Polynucleobacter sp. AP-Feld-500C-C5]MBU3633158.1 aromatic ring-hydroxylating dioxygenase subunit alpha [Polynucleobacter sp. AP-Feld-500C-C5]